MIHEFQGKYRFLSNFWPCRVEFEGMVYPSAEHAYQAAKFPPRGTGMRARIANMPGTHEGARSAKWLARQKASLEYVGGKEGWEEVKIHVMTRIVRSKFQLNADLREMLLVTGTEELQEGNNWNDRFWGICPPGSGKGRNELGKILMKIRKEISHGKA